MRTFRLGLIDKTVQFIERGFPPYIAFVLLLFFSSLFLVFFVVLMIVQFLNTGVAKDKMDLSFIISEDELRFAKLSDQLYTMRIMSGGCLSTMDDTNSAIDLFLSTQDYISSIRCYSDVYVNSEQVDVCDLTNPSWVDQWGFLENSDKDFFLTYMERRKEVLLDLETAFLDPENAGEPYPSSSDAAALVTSVDCSASTMNNDSFWTRIVSSVSTIQNELVPSYLTPLSETFQNSSQIKSLFVTPIVLACLGAIFFAPLMLLPLAGLRSSTLGGFQTAWGRTARKERRAAIKLAFSSAALQGVLHYRVVSRLKAVLGLLIVLQAAPELHDHQHLLLDDNDAMNSSSDSDSDFHSNSSSSVSVSENDFTDSSNPDFEDDDLSSSSSSKRSLEGGDHAVEPRLQESIRLHDSNVLDKENNKFSNGENAKLLGVSKQIDSSNSLFNFVDVNQTQASLIDQKYLNNNDYYAEKGRNMQNSGIKHYRGSEKVGEFSSSIKKINSRGGKVKKEIFDSEIGKKRKKNFRGIERTSNSNTVVQNGRSRLSILPKRNRSFSQNLFENNGHYNSNNQKKEKAKSFFNESASITTCIMTLLRTAEWAALQASRTADEASDFVAAHFPAPIDHPSIIPSVTIDPKNLSKDAYLRAAQIQQQLQHQINPGLLTSRFTTFGSIGRSLNNDPTVVIRGRTTSQPRIMDVFSPAPVPGLYGDDSGLPMLDQSIFSNEFNNNNNNNNNYNNNGQQQGPNQQALGGNHLTNYNNSVNTNNIANNFPLSSNHHLSHYPQSKDSSDPSSSSSNEFQLSGVYLRDVLEAVCFSVACERLSFASQINKPLTKPGKDNKILSSPQDPQQSLLESVVKVTVAPNVPTLIVADSKRLRRIIERLLLSAATALWGTAGAPGVKSLASSTGMIGGLHLEVGVAEVVSSARATARVEKISRQRQLEAEEGWQVSQIKKHLIQMEEKSKRQEMPRFTSKSTIAGGGGGASTFVTNTKPNTIITNNNNNMNNNSIHHQMKRMVRSSENQNFFPEYNSNNTNSRLLFSTTYGAGKQSPPEIQIDETEGIERGFVEGEVQRVDDNRPTSSSENQINHRNNVNVNYKNDKFVNVVTESSRYATHDEDKHTSKNKNINLLQSIGGLFRQFSSDSADTSSKFVNSNQINNNNYNNNNTNNRIRNSATPQRSTTLNSPTITHLPLTTHNLGSTMFLNKNLSSHVESPLMCDDDATVHTSGDFHLNNQGTSNNKNYAANATELPNDVRGFVLTFTLTSDVPEASHLLSSVNAGGGRKARVAILKGLSRVNEMVDLAASTSLRRFILGAACVLEAVKIPNPAYSAWLNIQAAHKTWNNKMAALNVGHINNHINNDSVRYSSSMKMNTKAVTSPNVFSPNFSNFEFPLQNYNVVHNQIHHQTDSLSTLPPPVLFHENINSTNISINNQNNISAVSLTLPDNLILMYNNNNLPKKGIDGNLTNVIMSGDVHKSVLPSAVAGHRLSILSNATTNSSINNNIHESHINSVYDQSSSHMNQSNPFNSNNLHNNSVLNSLHNSRPQSKPSSSSSFDAHRNNAIIQYPPLPFDMDSSEESEFHDLIDFERTGCVYPLAGENAFPDPSVNASFFGNLHHQHTSSKAFNLNGSPTKLYAKSIISPPRKSSSHVPITNTRNNFDNPKLTSHDLFSPLSNTHTSHSSPFFSIGSVNSKTVQNGEYLNLNLHSINSANSATLSPSSLILLKKIVNNNSPPNRMTADATATIGGSYNGDVLRSLAAADGMNHSNIPRISNASITGSNLFINGQFADQHEMINCNSDESSFNMFDRVTNEEANDSLVNQIAHNASSSFIPLNTTVNSQLSNALVYGTGVKGNRELAATDSFQISSHSSSSLSSSSSSHGFSTDVSDDEGRLLAARTSIFSLAVNNGNNGGTQIVSNNNNNNNSASNGQGGHSLNSNHFHKNSMKRASTIRQDSLFFPAVAATNNSNPSNFGILSTGTSVYNPELQSGLYNANTFLRQVSRGGRRRTATGASYANMPITATIQNNSKNNPGGFILSSNSILPLSPNNGSSLLKGLVPIEAQYSTTPVKILSKWDPNGSGQITSDLATEFYNMNERNKSASKIPTNLRGTSDIVNNKAALDVSVTSPMNYNHIDKNYLSSLINAEFNSLMPTSTPPPNRSVSVPSPSNKFNSHNDLIPDIPNGYHLNTKIDSITQNENSITHAQDQRLLNDFDDLICGIQPLNSNSALDPKNLDAHNSSTIDSNTPIIIPSSHVTTNTNTMNALVPPLNSTIAAGMSQTRRVSIMLSPDQNNSTNNINNNIIPTVLNTPGNQNHRKMSSFFDFHPSNTATSLHNSINNGNNNSSSNNNVNNAQNSYITKSKPPPKTIRRLKASLEIEAFGRTTLSDFTPGLHSAANRVMTKSSSVPIVICAGLGAMSLSNLVSTTAAMGFKLLNFGSDGGSLVRYLVSKLFTQQDVTFSSGNTINVQQLHQQISGGLFVHGNSTADLNGMSSLNYNTMESTDFPAKLNTTTGVASVVNSNLGVSRTATFVNSGRLPLLCSSKRTTNNQNDQNINPSSYGDFAGVVMNAPSQFLENTLHRRQNLLMQNVSQVMNNLSPTYQFNGVHMNEMDEMNNELNSSIPYNKKLGVSRIGSDLFSKQLPLNLPTRESNQNVRSQLSTTSSVSGNIHHLQQQPTISFASINNIQNASPLKTFGMVTPKSNPGPTKSFLSTHSINQNDYDGLQPSIQIPSGSTMNQNPNNVSPTSFLYDVFNLATSPSSPQNSPLKDGLFSHQNVNTNNNMNPNNNIFSTAFNQITSSPSSPLGFLSFGNANLLKDIGSFGREFPLVAIFIGDGIVEESKLNDKDEEGKKKKNKATECIACCFKFFSHVVCKSCKKEKKRQKKNHSDQELAKNNMNNHLVEKLDHIVDSNKSPSQKGKVNRADTDTDGVLHRLHQPNNTEASRSYLSIPAIGSKPGNQALNSAGLTRAFTHKGHTASNESFVKKSGLQNNAAIKNDNENNSEKSSLSSHSSSEQPFHSESDRVAAAVSAILQLKIQKTTEKNLNIIANLQKSSRRTQPLIPTSIPIVTRVSPPTDLSLIPKGFPAALSCPKTTAALLFDPHSRAALRQSLLSSTNPLFFHSSSASVPRDINQFDPRIAYFSAAPEEVLMFLLRPVGGLVFHLQAPLTSHIISAVSHSGMPASSSSLGVTWMDIRNSFLSKSLIPNSPNMPHYAGLNFGHNNNNNNLIPFPTNLSLLRSSSPSLANSPLQRHLTMPATGTLGHQFELSNGLSQPRTPLSRAESSIKKRVISPPPPPLPPLVTNSVLDVHFPVDNSQQNYTATPESDSLHNLSAILSNNNNNGNTSIFANTSTTTPSKCWSCCSSFFVKLFFCLLYPFSRCFFALSLCLSTCFRVICGEKNIHLVVSTHAISSRTTTAGKSLRSQHSRTSRHNNSNRNQDFKSYPSDNKKQNHNSSNGGTDREDSISISPHQRQSSREKRTYHNRKSRSPPVGNRRADNKKQEQWERRYSIKGIINQFRINSRSYKESFSHQELDQYMSNSNRKNVTSMLNNNKVKLMSESIPRLSFLIPHFLNQDAANTGGVSFANGGIKGADEQTALYLMMLNQLSPANVIADLAKKTMKAILDAESSAPVCDLVVDPYFVGDKLNIGFSQKSLSATPMTLRLKSMHEHPPNGNDKNSGSLFLNLNQNPVVSTGIPRELLINSEAARAFSLLHYGLQKNHHLLVGGSQQMRVAVQCVLFAFNRSHLARGGVPSELDFNSELESITVRIPWLDDELSYKSNIVFDAISAYHKGVYKIFKSHVHAHRVHLLKLMSTSTPLADKSLNASPQQIINTTSDNSAVQNQIKPTLPSHPNSHLPLDLFSLKDTSISNNQNILRNVRFHPDLRSGLGLSVETVSNSAILLPSHPLPGANDTNDKLNQTTPVMPVNSSSSTAVFNSGNSIISGKEPDVNTSPPKNRLIAQLTPYKMALNIFDMLNHDISGGNILFDGSDSIFPTRNTFNYPKMLEGASKNLVKDSTLEEEQRHLTKQFLLNVSSEVASEFHHKSRSDSDLPIPNQSPFHLNAFIKQQTTSSSSASSGLVDFVTSRIHIARLTAQKCVSVGSHSVTSKSELKKQRQKYLRRLPSSTVPAVPMRPETATSAASNINKDALIVFENKRARQRSQKIPHQSEVIEKVLQKRAAFESLHRSYATVVAQTVLFNNLFSVNSLSDTMTTLSLQEDNIKKNQFEVNNSRNEVGRISMISSAPRLLKSIQSIVHNSNHSISGKTLAQKQDLNLGEISQPLTLKNEGNHFHLSDLGLTNVNFSHFDDAGNINKNIAVANSTSLSKKFSKNFDKDNAMSASLGHSLQISRATGIEHKENGLSSNEDDFDVNDANVMNGLSRSVSPLGNGSQINDDYFPGPSSLSKREISSKSLASSITKLRSSRKNNNNLRGGNSLLKEKNNRPHPASFFKAPLLAIPPMVPDRISNADSSLPPPSPLSVMASLSNRGLERASNSLLSKPAISGFSRSNSLNPSIAADVRGRNGSHSRLTSENNGNFQQSLRKFPSSFAYDSNLLGISTRLERDLSMRPNSKRNPLLRNISAEHAEQQLHDKIIKASTFGKSIQMDKNNKKSLSSFFQRKNRQFNPNNQYGVTDVIQNNQSLLIPSFSDEIPSNNNNSNGGLDVNIKSYLKKQSSFVNQLSDESQSSFSSFSSSSSTSSSELSGNEQLSTPSEIDTLTGLSINIYSTAEKETPSKRSAHFEPNAVVNLQSMDTIELTTVNMDTNTDTTNSSLAVTKKNPLLRRSLSLQDQTRSNQNVEALPIDIQTHRHRNRALSSVFLSQTSGITNRQSMQSSTGNLYKESQNNISEGNNLIINIDLKIAALCSAVRRLGISRARADLGLQSCAADVGGSEIISRLRSNSRRSLNGNSPLNYRSSIEGDSGDSPFGIELSGLDDVRRSYKSTMETAHNAEGRIFHSNALNIRYPINKFLSNEPVDIFSAWKWAQNVDGIGELSLSDLLGDSCDESNAANHCMSTDDGNGSLHFSHDDNFTSDEEDDTHRIQKFHRNNHNQFSYRAHDAAIALSEVDNASSMIGGRRRPTIGSASVFSMDSNFTSGNRFSIGNRLPPRISHHIFVPSQNQPNSLDLTKRTLTNDPHFIRGILKTVLVESASRRSIPPNALLNLLTEQFINRVPLQTLKALAEISCPSAFSPYLSTVPVLSLVNDGSRIPFCESQNLGLPNETRTKADFMKSKVFKRKFTKNSTFAHLRNESEYIHGYYIKKAIRCLKNNPDYISSLSFAKHIRLATDILVCATMMQSNLPSRNKSRITFSCASICFSCLNTLRARHLPYSTPTLIVGRMLSALLLATCQDFEILISKLDPNHSSPALLVLTMLCSSSLVAPGLTESFFSGRPSNCSTGDKLSGPGIQFLPSTIQHLFTLFDAPSPKISSSSVTTGGVLSMSQPFNAGIEVDAGADQPHGRAGVDSIVDRPETVLGELNYLSAVRNILSLPDEYEKEKAQKRKQAYRRAVEKIAAMKKLARGDRKNRPFAIRRVSAANLNSSGGGVSAGTDHDLGNSESEVDLRTQMTKSNDAMISKFENPENTLTDVEEEEFYSVSSSSSSSSSSDSESELSTLNEHEVRQSFRPASWSKDVKINNSSIFSLEQNKIFMDKNGNQTVATSSLPVGNDLSDLTSPVFMLPRTPSVDSVRVDSARDIKIWSSTSSSSSSSSFLSDSKRLFRPPPRDLQQQNQQQQQLGAIFSSNGYPSNQQPQHDNKPFLPATKQSASPLDHSFTSQRNIARHMSGTGSFATSRLSSSLRRGSQPKARRFLRFYSLKTQPPNPTPVFSLLYPSESLKSLRTLFHASHASLSGPLGPSPSSSAQILSLLPESTFQATNAFSNRDWAAHYQDRLDLFDTNENIPLNDDLLWASKHHVSMPASTTRSIKTSTWSQSHNAFLPSPPPLLSKILAQAHKHVPAALLLLHLHPDTNVLSPEEHKTMRIRIGDAKHALLRLFAASIPALSCHILTSLTNNHNLKKENPTLIAPDKVPSTWSSTVRDTLRWASELSCQINAERLLRVAACSMSPTSMANSTTYSHTLPVSRSGRTRSSQPVKMSIFVNSLGSLASNLTSNDGRESNLSRGRVSRAAITFAWSACGPLLEALLGISSAVSILLDCSQQNSVNRADGVNCSLMENNRLPFIPRRLVAFCMKNNDKSTMNDRRKVGMSSLLARCLDEAAASMTLWLASAKILPNLNVVLKNPPNNSSQKIDSGQRESSVIQKKSNLMTTTKGMADRGIDPLPQPNITVNMSRGLLQNKPRRSSIMTPGGGGHFPAFKAAPVLDGNEIDINEEVNPVPKLVKSTHGLNNDGMLFHPLIFANSPSKDAQSPNGLNSSVHNISSRVLLLPILANGSNTLGTSSQTLASLSRRNFLTADNMSGLLSKTVNNTFTSTNQSSNLSQLRDTTNHSNTISRLQSDVPSDLAKIVSSSLALDIIKNEMGEEASRNNFSSTRENVASMLLLKTPLAKTQAEQNSFEGFQAASRSSLHFGLSSQLDFHSENSDSGEELNDSFDENSDSNEDKKMKLPLSSQWHRPTSRTSPSIQKIPKNELKNNEESYSVSSF